MVKEFQERDSGVIRKMLAGLMILFVGAMLGGCLVLEEKYNAEKSRSLNFQRLLAQEEKRTAELDNEVKRTKQELAAFEARNRELAGQVESVRGQMARLQEEAEAIKEAAVLERKALEDMRRAGAAGIRARKSGGGADGFSDLGAQEPDLFRDQSGRELMAMPDSAGITKPGGAVHVVRPGETLFRISRKYGIEVERLKKINKLPDDIIEVGQKLIVEAE